MKYPLWNSNKNVFSRNKLLHGKSINCTPCCITYVHLYTLWITISVFGVKYFILKYRKPPSWKKSHIVQNISQGIMNIAEKPPCSTSTDTRQQIGGRHCAYYNRVTHLFKGNKALYRRKRFLNRLTIEKTKMWEVEINSTRKPPLWTHEMKSDSVVAG